jgi:hypothetical protein
MSNRWPAGGYAQLGSGRVLGEVIDSASRLPRVPLEEIGSLVTERLHIVRKGEWLTLIGHRYGFPRADEVYGYDKNEPLRQLRPDPNSLAAGDELWIPPCPYETELEQKSAGGGPYEIKVRPAQNEKLTATLYDAEGNALADKPYELKIGAHAVEGTTDDKGKLEEEFDSKYLQYGTYALTIDGKKIPLGIGVLDPLESNQGIQARLKNLGYYDGPIDGVLGSDSRDAIRRFQKDNAPLKVDGVAGPNTRQKLQEQYEANA